MMRMTKVMMEEMVEKEFLLFLCLLERQLEKVPLLLCLV